MKKILIVGPGKKAKGGINTVIENIMEYKIEDIKIKRIETFRETNIIFKILIYLFSLIKIVAYLLFCKIDIIHIHSASKGSFIRKSIILNISKIFKVKTIFHIHGSNFEVYINETHNKKYMINTLERADIIIVLSENMRNLIEKLSQNTNIYILNNSVIIPERNLYNNDGNIVLFLGRIGIRKGFYDLIEAIKKIEMNISSSITFEICGDGEIEKAIKLTKNMKNVNIRGWINFEEKNYLMSDTILNVLPSYHEGLPMTILETMSRGIPNISTNIAGIPDVIINDDNGYLITPGNIEELSIKLETLINNKIKRLEFSERAYNQIKNNFNSSVIFEKLVDIYKKL